jgi:hypothetical protein
MARAKSKTVAVRPGTAVALPGSWREKAKQSIAKGKEQSAKLPAASGNFLSFRNGTISLGGAKLENPLPLVLLAYTYERSYFSKPFQPDVAATPDCFSFDGVAPHAEAKVPQSDKCKGCRFDDFGSAANGKGKGCKEGAKFAAIHADSLESPEKIKAAQIIVGRLSVMNSKGFRNYVGYFEESDTPIWAGISTLTVVPDSASQYAASFESSVAELSDAELDAIAARVDEADKLLLMPPPDMEEAKPAAKGVPARRRKF